MYYDSITGLPSLESFIDFASKMWSASKSGRFVVLSLNIGSFHKLNQLYGYREGNTVLSTLAQRMVRSLDYMLSACRTDADSFIVLLDSDLQPLSSMAERLKNDFHDFTQHMHTLYPNVLLPLKGGICLLTREVPSLEKAIEYAVMARFSLENSNAEEDLLLAFYHEALGSFQQETRILPLFDDIMVNNHLIIYLQPKFQLDSQIPTGAEALMRIMDTKGRLLKPAAFIPVLDKYGLSSEIDLMVIETILKLILKWRSNGLEPIPVSINLATKDFFSSDFMRIFADIIEKYEPVQQYLEFEIEAAAYYHNINYMEQVVSKFHDLGCLVSIDGFGGDNLTLSSLEIPPVDMVKFNRNFLQTGMKNPNNIYILKKLTEMFEACHIPVLCEGIENAQEEQFIRECGISYVQGFYYGRPVPFDIFQKKYMLTKPAHLISL